MIKVKLLTDVQYGGSYHEEGSIINYKGDKAPVWGKEVSEEEAKAVEAEAPAKEAPAVDEHEEALKTAQSMDQPKVADAVEGKIVKPVENPETTAPEVDDLAALEASYHAEPAEVPVINDDEVVAVNDLEDDAAEESTQEEAQAPEAEEAVGPLKKPASEYTEEELAALSPQARGHITRKLNEAK